MQSVFNIDKASYVMAPYLFRASAKRLLTLAAPSPPIISINSDPFMERKGTFDSVAIAFASIVFPQPGGPVNKAPASRDCNGFIILCSTVMTL